MFITVLRYKFGKRKRYKVSAFVDKMFELFGEVPYSVVLKFTEKILSSDIKASDGVRPGHEITSLESNRNPNYGTYRPKDDSSEEPPTGLKISIDLTKPAGTPTEATPLKKEEPKGAVPTKEPTDGSPTAPIEESEGILEAVTDTEGVASSDIDFDRPEPMPIVIRSKRKINIFKLLPELEVDNEWSFLKRSKKSTLCDTRRCNINFDYVKQNQYYMDFSKFSSLNPEMKARAAKYGLTRPELKYEQPKDLDVIKFSKKLSRGGNVRSSLVKALKFLDKFSRVNQARSIVKGRLQFEADCAARADAAAKRADRLAELIPGVPIKPDEVAADMEAAEDKATETAFKSHLHVEKISNRVLSTHAAIESVPLAIDTAAKDLTAMNEARRARADYHEKRKVISPLDITESVMLGSDIPNSPLWSEKLCIDVLKKTVPGIADRGLYMEAFSQYKMGLRLNSFLNSKNSTNFSSFLVTIMSNEGKPTLNMLVKLYYALTQSHCKWPRNEFTKSLDIVRYFEVSFNWIIAQPLFNGLWLSGLPKFLSKNHLHCINSDDLETMQTSDVPKTAYHAFGTSEPSYLSSLYNDVCKRFFTHPINADVPYFHRITKSFNAFLSDDWLFWSQSYYYGSYEFELANQDFQFFATAKLSDTLAMLNRLECRLTRTNVILGDIIKRSRAHPEQRLRFSTYKFTNLLRLVATFNSLSSFTNVPKPPTYVVYSACSTTSLNIDTELARDTYNALFVKITQINIFKDYLDCNYGWLLNLKSSESFDGKTSKRALGQFNNRELVTIKNTTMLILRCVAAVRRCIERHHTNLQSPFNACGLSKASMAFDFLTAHSISSHTNFRNNTTIMHYGNLRLVFIGKHTLARQQITYEYLLRLQRTAYVSEYERYVASRCLFMQDSMAVSLLLESGFTLEDPCKGREVRASTASHDSIVLVPENINTGKYFLFTVSKTYTLTPTQVKVLHTLYNVGATINKHRVIVDGPLYKSRAGLVPNMEEASMSISERFDLYSEAILGGIPKDAWNSAFSADNMSIKFPKFGKLPPRPPLPNPWTNQLFWETTDVAWYTDEESEEYDLDGIVNDDKRVPYIYNKADNYSSSEDYSSDDDMGANIPKIDLRNSNGGGFSSISSIETLESSLNGANTLLSDQSLTGLLINKSFAGLKSADFMRTWYNGNKQYRNVSRLQLNYSSKSPEFESVGSKYYKHISTKPSLDLGSRFSSFVNNLKPTLGLYTTKRKTFVAKRKVTKQCAIFRLANPKNRSGKLLSMIKLAHFTKIGGSGRTRLKTGFFNLVNEDFCDVTRSSMYKRKQSMYQNFGKDSVNNIVMRRRLMRAG